MLLIIALVWAMLLIVTALLYSLCSYYFAIVPHYLSSISHSHSPTYKIRSSGKHRLQFLIMHFTLSRRYFSLFDYKELVG